MNSATRGLVLLLALAPACGPTASDPTGSASSTGASSTGAATTSTNGTTAPTTGAPDLCACDDPVVHEGDLDFADIAMYQGACLSEVTGTLQISDVDDPTLLSPLSRLRRVDWLSVTNNPTLVDIAPLACLREVTTIRIFNSPALADLSALDGLIRAEDVAISEAPIAKLPTFAPEFQGVRTLVLGALPALVDVDPVAAWPGLSDPNTEYGGLNLIIDRCPLLTSVAGLAGPLTAAPGDPASEFLGVYIRLNDLPSLTSLHGLEPLVAGDVELRELPALADLGALSAFERAGDLVLASLPAVTSLEGLGHLTQATSMLIGDCSDDDGLAITSLAGLDVLAAVSSLSILNNPALTALTGAPALDSVENLSIVDNPLLSPNAVDAFNAQVQPLLACAGDFVACGCSGLIPAAVTFECPAMWSGGSAVTASGEGGPVDGVTAFFGWYGNFEHDLALVILDAGSDIEAAKSAGLDYYDGAPKVMIQTARDYPQWLGVGPELATVVDTNWNPHEANVELTITGRLGNWDTLDPADPPRLVGELSTAGPQATLVDGPFEAVFCEAFTHFRNPG